MSNKNSLPCSISYEEGWYARENDGYVDFRWMQREASCSFSEVEDPAFKILKIRTGHPFFGETDPVLSLKLREKRLGEIEIFAGEREYLIPVGVPTDDFRLDFALNKTFPEKISQDSRELGIMVKNIELLSLPAGSLHYKDGWHEKEQDDHFTFRWTDRAASLFVARDLLKDHTYLQFHADSPFADFSQSAQVSIDGHSLGDIPVLQKWSHYIISLEEFKDKFRPQLENRDWCGELRFQISRTFQEDAHGESPRTLGIKIRDITFHDDREEYLRFQTFHQNAVLNRREMLEGKTRLSSFPLYLGIDIYGKCNIKPPCVYCEWDWMKKAEGENARINVDEHTLEGYGPFFLASRHLVNCSIGEPLLNPRLKEIMTLSDDNHKILEMATNGQALTPDIVKAMAGKNIILYISLDAASRETYAKIRNECWDSIVPNLVLLNQERKKQHNLPRIFMVFMPMKVNSDDLEEYFKLCKKIEADSLILRPLNFIGHTDIMITRAGYTFHYQNELLSRDELERVFRKSREFSQKYGVEVGSQFDFGLTENLKFENREAGQTA